MRRQGAVLAHTHGSVQSHTHGSVQSPRTHLSAVGDGTCLSMMSSRTSSGATNAPSAISAHSRVTDAVADTSATASPGLQCTGSTHTHPTQHTP
jgi:hypothetical protein